MRWLICAAVLLSTPLASAGEQVLEVGQKALPVRTKMNVKYRVRRNEFGSLYGEQGSLKVVLPGTQHLELLRTVVKDAQLPSNNGQAHAAKIVVSRFTGDSKLIVRGDNAEVRRVEHLVRQRTSPRNNLTDKVVDRAP